MKRKDNNAELRNAVPGDVMEEYLAELKGQIRDRHAKEFVSEEIRNHIEEQTEAYECEGMMHNEALAAAVRDMGDPVRVGADMDKIHRPHMEWKFLVYVVLISLLSLAVHYLINTGAHEVIRESAHAQSIVTPLLRGQVIGIVFGLVVMLAVYRLDYTVLLGRSRVIGGGYLVLLAVLSFVFGFRVNGSYMMLRIGTGAISMRVLWLFYLPVFAGILYELRSKEKSHLLQIPVWMIAPLLSQWILGELLISFALFQLITETALVCLAIWKGWYAISKKRLCYGVAGGFVSGTVALIVAFQNMESYRVQRLQSWLGHLGIGNSTPDPDGMDYINVRLQEVFAQSNMIGRSDPAAEIMSMMPGFRDDLILASIAAFFGKLAVAGILLAIGILAVYIFRISLRQKNCLGYIVGCACGIMIALQSIGNAMIVFGLLPLSSSTLPLFSHGTSYGIMNYALLGLILSIYRYKDIRVEKAVEYSEKAVL